MHDNLVILAGGASSRMKNLGVDNNLSTQEIEQANHISKGLIGVGHNWRPLIDYLLYNAKSAGYKNIYIVIGEQGEMFREFYGKQLKNNIFHGLKISFAVQYIPQERIKPFGTADALLQTVEQYPELNLQYYSVCNSDNLYSVEALLALRKSASPNAFIGYDRDALEFTKKRISSFAVVKLDYSNHLLDIIEKPTADEVDKYKDKEGKTRVSMNIFKFDGKSFYPFLRNCPINTERDEKELPTALLNLQKHKPGTAVGIPFSEHVPDLTTKEDIATVKEYLKKHYPSMSW